MSDGTKIGGVFSTKSYASSFPLDEQIYLEQVWELVNDDFIMPVENSKGIIILGKNISSIEFVKLENES